MKRVLSLIIGILLCGVTAFAAVDSKQWMAGLNDLYFVSQLSLPGAHDAATGHGFSGIDAIVGALSGKCQDLKIDAQWDAGVRVFDLRPTDADGSPICHGSLTTNINLSEALTIIKGRLSSYPSECAIVIMRNENNGGSTDNWKSRITAVMNNFSDVVVPFNPNLRLGSVRGKILVLSRDYFADGLTISGWGHALNYVDASANGVSFRVQDYYEVTNADGKSAAITDLLAQARSNTSRNRVFINHTSGYTGSTGTNSAISSNANTCNTLALNTINDNPGPTGIVMMDFAGSSSNNGANLVNAIIAQNRQPVDTELSATLHATLDLARDEGVSAAALADAESLISNPTTDLGINDGIHLLRSARRISAWSVPDVYTGTATPAAGEEYFLYNIGTGLWLNNGSDWNTHAAVDIYPLAVKLIAADGQKFKLQTHMFAGKEEKWVNWNAYVDTPSQDTWQFNPVPGKTNVFTINSEGNRTDVGRLLGYDPNGPTDKGDYQYWSTVAKDREGIDNPCNQWKLVTRAEREALMDQASASNPVDVSFLIYNGGLSRVWGLNMWTKTCDGGNGGAHITSGDDNDFNRNADYGYEVWNANAFSFTQTLTALRPGKYRLSACGFYRQGDGNFQANVVNAGGDLISEAYLVANDQRQPLPNIATEAGRMPAIASQASNAGTFVNWPAQALAAFEMGLYDTSVDVVVGTEGTLSIGVIQDHKTTDASWALFDTFRLAYLGPALVGDVNRDGAVTIADVTALVNIILGKDNGSTPVYDHVAADVNADGAITIADVTALVNIILGK